MARVKKAKDLETTETAEAVEVAQPPERSRADLLRERLTSNNAERVALEKALAEEGQALPAVVRDAAEANALLADLGRIDWEIAQLKAEADAKIAEVADPLENRIAELTAAADDIEARLERFAHDNRHTFPGKEMKTLTLPNGKLAFRAGQADFVVDDERQVLQHIAAKRLGSGFVYEIKKIDTASFAKRPDIAREVPGGRWVPPAEKFAAIPDKRVAPVVEQPNPGRTD